VAGQEGAGVGWGPQAKHPIVTPRALPSVLSTGRVHECICVLRESKPEPLASFACVILACADTSEPRFCLLRAQTTRTTWPMLP